MKCSYLGMNNIVSLLEPLFNEIKANLVSRMNARPNLIGTLVPLSYVRMKSYRFHNLRIYGRLRICFFFVFLNYLGFMDDFCLLNYLTFFCCVFLIIKVVC